MGTHLEALKKIDAMPNLSGEERAEARKVLSELREDPEQMIQASLATSTKANAAAQERQRACRQAEAALRQMQGGEASIDRMPRASLFLTVAGLAKLRDGQAKEAFADLSRAVEIHRMQRGAAEVRQLAGLALAAHQLGRQADAARLRQQMQDLGRNAPADQFKDAEPWMQEVEATIQRGPDAADHEAIFLVVANCEDAGWMRRDLKTYMAGRATVVREEGARTAMPDRQDVIFDRGKLETARAWDFRESGLTRSRSLFENAAVTRDGETATLHYESTVQNGDWWRTWEVHWKLARVDGQWKITHGRAWPVRGLEEGHGVRYDADWWKARDSDVAKAEGLEKAHALLRALRPKEALELLRQRTASKDVTAEEWALRGSTALQMGEVDEARQAYRTAERLDPKASLHAAINGALLEMRGPKGETFSVAFAPNGELFSGGRDGIVRVWDSAGKMLRSAETPREPRSGNEVLDLAVSSDGKRLALARTSIYLYDPIKLERRRRAGGHNQQIYRLSFSGDGNRLVSASADSTARVWSLSGGDELELAGHTAQVLGAVFSPDRRTLATASFDQTARLWDAQSGVLIRSFTGHTGKLMRVAFAPDGKMLATAGANGEVKVWDVETGKVMREFKVEQVDMEVVAFSPNGNWLAAAGDHGEMRLWSTRDWRLVRVPRGHEKRVFSLAFSKDSKRLAAGAGDEAIRVWEMPGD
jgi:tetratricopeptide (TPR) repeat protein